jgi:Acyl-CoA synthetases (AMP-forming)/AMP-acid ligases II
MMKTKGEYDNKTIGTILPCNEVRIKNNEIQVKGENVMIGYYNNPEKSQNSIVNGWFSTGDIGYMEGDNLYICGRSKNIIILSNGKNIYPEEIEEFFYDNKDILEAVVFEVKFGHEGVLAAIMYVSQNIYNHKEAIQKCVNNINSKLPSFKKVRKYYVSDRSFDRTSTNKIIRKEAIERGIRMEVETQVFDILSKMTNSSQKNLSIDTNLFIDLGLESITIIELIIKCEDTFGISVDEDKIADLTTIKDIINLVINEVTKKV